MRWLLLVALLAETAAADPCDDAHGEPIPTPLRDGGYDLQRSACVRDETTVTVLGHALVDTPAFRGILGVRVLAWRRVALSDSWELAFGGQAAAYTFAQNAVTKVNETRFGPAVAGVVYRFDNAAIVTTLELPFTRPDSDADHVSGQSSVVTTNRLAERWVLHGRMGIVGEHVTSVGGDVTRIALRAGADVVRVGRRIALHAGAEVQAGWYDGLDTVLVRTGVAWQWQRFPARLVASVGVPFGGDDRTDVVAGIGLAMTTPGFCPFAC